MTATAWGWVAHLRAGGTTPWLEWSGEASPSARVLPGAQQLELLRTLNLAGGRRQPDLADRVLTAAAPGRGKPDLALVGVASSPYGPQPVDPSLLPADELIRVATSVLAEDVVALGVPTPARQLRRVWRRGYRLAGDPLEVAHVRDHLTSRGRAAGGRGRHDPDPRRLRSTRCWPTCGVAGASSAAPAAGWSGCASGSSATTCHRAIDLAAVADRHRARHERIQVVLDHSSLPALLGVRRLPLPVRPGADSAELARRIATVVGTPGAARRAGRADDRTRCSHGCR